MLNLCTRKILRDLWVNKMRTALIVITIAIGVFAVGTIAQSWVILSRNLSDAFNAVNPSNAKIRTGNTFSSDVVENIREMQGVAQAEGRSVLFVRVNVGPDQWRTLQIMTRDNYDNLIVNKLNRESGVWPPKNRQMLLERSSLDFLQLAVGNIATIRLPDGTMEKLEVAGVLHDLNRLPTPVSYTGYGYVTSETFECLTGKRGFNTLDITIEGDLNDKVHITSVVEQVSNRLEDNGLTITHKMIPAPGKHPLDNIIQSIISLLGILAMLALILSAFLVFNIISAVLTQQIQQIGIIKSIGGRSRVIGNMYAGTVIIYGMLALTISVPLAMLMSRYCSIFFASELNFDVTNFQIPVFVYVLEGFVGLGLPLLAAFFPIVSVTRISVREAMSRAGTSSNDFGAAGFEKLLKMLRGLPMTFLYALRNVFRKKIRLVLTLITLILTGAIFIAVITLRVSLAQTLDEIAAYWQEDVYVQFNRQYRFTSIENQLRDLPGIKTLEGRMMKQGFRMRPDGSEGTDTITIYGISPKTQFLTPQVLEGRWLLPEDQYGVVINVGLRSLEPDLSVGEMIKLKIKGNTSEWKIVGIVTSQLIGGETLIAPVVYAPYEYFSSTLNEKRQINEILVGTENNDPIYVTNVSKTLEDRLDSKNTQIFSIRTYQETRSSLENSFDIVLGLLLIMSLVFAVVGSLGLMCMMSLNVIERTREIGVLRVVGGSRKVIAKIVVAEGNFCGVISWFFGVLLAYPLGNALGVVVGMTSIYVPLTGVVPYWAAMIWFIMVIILSTIASILPARSASLLSVHETFSYE